MIDEKRFTSHLVDRLATEAGKLRKKRQLEKSSDPDVRACTDQVLKNHGFDKTLSDTDYNELRSAILSNLSKRSHRSRKRNIASGVTVVKTRQPSIKPQRFREFLFPNLGLGFPVSTKRRRYA